MSLPRGLLPGPPKITRTFRSQYRPARGRVRRQSNADGTAGVSWGGGARAPHRLHERGKSRPGAKRVTRARGLSLRLALGAGRWRVFQQLLTESMVLALTGGALGLLLCALGDPAAGGDVIERHFRSACWNLARIDVWVFMFTLAISVATGIIFGVVPAVLGAPRDLNASLREASAPPPRECAGGAFAPL